MFDEAFEVDGLIFRKAVDQDVAKILAFSDIFLRRDVLIIRQYILNNIKRGDVWLVLDGEKLCAFSMSGYKTKSCLWNLYVHPKYRKRHIGGMLIEHTKPQIIRSKRDQVTGDPTPFYEKMGYRITQANQGAKKNINIMEYFGSVDSGVPIQEAII